VNKSEIRKKILKIREKKRYKSLNINFEYLLKFLKKNKNIGKVIGGYYPYNYEIDAIEILINLEKQNYQISLVNPTPSSAAFSAFTITKSIFFFLI